LEGLGPGGSVLGGREVIAAEVEEIVDPVMGGEVRNHLVANPVYGQLPQPRLCQVLERIEIRRRTRFQEPTPLPAGLTLEHVMPQLWAPNWPLPNGEMSPSDD